jgi:hypothetical protein
MMALFVIQYQPTKYPECLGDGLVLTIPLQPLATLVLLTHPTLIV